LGRYTNGGPDVLETLILYFLSEVFLLKEIDSGIWVLVGSIVQIATFMGYHRDAAHFPHISPFEGEMRRRVWSMIVQMDSSIATQVGHVRLIKGNETNTAEPRNLADSDFDETTTDLPLSRRETEVTPILYSLAKQRLCSVEVQVFELVNDVQPYPYFKVTQLDKQIDEAQAALPPYMKWEDLAHSLGLPLLVMMQRIWLEICIQRLKMVLHKKSLSTIPGTNEQANDLHVLASQSTCVAAAARILEFHHLIDEETRADGRLYQIRWRASTALTNDFLLATSVLGFYLQTCVNAAPERLGQPQHQAVLVDRTRSLLKTSQAIWLSLSVDSAEARKAYSAIRYVLGDCGMPSEPIDVGNIMWPAAPRHLALPR
jgi:hypothetical protein